MRRRVVNFLFVLIAIVFLGFSLALVALADKGPHGNYMALTDSCAACHRTHTGPGARLLNSSAQGNAFCYSCHDGTGAPPAPVISTHANVDFGGGVEASFSLSCAQCHDPHGNPGNLYTIRDYVVVQGGATPISSGPVVFTATNGLNSYDDGISTLASRICVSCHISSDNAGYPMANHIGGAGHMGGTVNYTGQDCIVCHPHSLDEVRSTLDGFMPGGGCTDCHARAQDRSGVGPDGGRRAIVPEFGAITTTTTIASHHVISSTGPITGSVVTDADCKMCHAAELANHADGYLQLTNVDTSAIYAESTPGAFRPEIISLSDSKTLRPFCQSCHDGDGAGGDITPFSDGRIVPPVDSVAWSLSTHDTGGTFNAGYGCLGDGTTSGCHATGHGSASEKLLSNGAESITTTVTIDTLCYNCHTEGMVQNDALSNNRPGGYVSADDIQEAFAKSERHDLGTAFTRNSNNFTIQCTSCHNPHVVTGRYWDAAGGVTPVTRPDFSDAANNPRAMGTILWGDEAGEKMDDFAAQGSGSGGWYYKTAQGYPLGSSGLPMDQPAIYRPPKSGNGYDAEFSGDVLPDYTTLCLDCHTYRMSAANPPVNWGQGIACTDNSVDPPDQRIECGADHGLGRAGRPLYISDVGTAGFWGSSGNPDVIFDMNYVTRGRSNGHFMRWPYDSADRGAGINFVLSCTDCHEAHGSNRGGIIRERFNVNANGDCGAGGDPDPNGESCADGGNWNSFCNACHYYYGGQHAGMSCGNASCHEANSIHRIIHTVDSGASTRLMLTATGYESNFQRPDFTPAIVTVAGHIGSNELLVTFLEGVWANSDLSGALTANDFWLFDNNNDNPKTITGLTHTAGAVTAIITLDAPLIAADLAVDTLAMRPASAWAWYAGGYVNAATGVIPAQAVSAGPWPVTISGPPPASIVSVSGSVGFNQLLVTFSEGVYSALGQAGPLEPGDFTLTDVGGDNGRTISGVTHTPGTPNAILTMTAPLVAGDISLDTIAAVANSIFDAYDNAVGTTAATISGSTCPTWGTSFQLNESSGSLMTFITLDETGLLTGTIYTTPTLTLPGDGYFYGDENQATYIEFDRNPTCLREANSLTLEARIFTSIVDLDYDDSNGDGLDDDYDFDNDPLTTLPGGRNSTQQRLFERRRAIQFTIQRANWAGDYVAARAGRARVMIKYFVDPASRHTCPHPQWPGDTYVGNDSRWHQVSSDIDQYPIIANHWYRIRVVFNANKSRIPVDIWADDQGTDGNDTGELWPGFINIAQPDPEDSSSCRWGALPGDFMATEDQFSFIGDNFDHTDSPGSSNNQIFKGLIDWLTWQPIADYSGVDDLPNTRILTSPKQTFYLPLVLKGAGFGPGELIPSPSPAPSDSPGHALYLPLIMKNAHLETGEPASNPSPAPTEQPSLPPAPNELPKQIIYLPMVRR